MTDPTAEARPPVSPAIELRDEDEEIRQEAVDAVAAAIAAGDRGLLAAMTADLHETDIAELIEALPAEDRPKLIELLGADFDFAALTEVDDGVREEILEELSPETVAEGVRELESDDAVYILEDLEEAEQKEVLSKLPDSERVALQRSLDYPEDSAGRLMRTEMVAVAPFWTVGRTIDFLREAEELPDDFTEIFVVDPSHRLVGVVPLSKLLRTKRPILISDLMDQPDHRVHVTEDEEDVARMFAKYNLVSAPVVDESERLVGVMTIDDVVDVMSDEVDEDIKALGGVKSDEEISDKVAPIVRGRFPWLFANLLTAFVSASVIGHFSGSLEKMVALAVLMPIVASMGGNAGTQSMTVAVRALATQDLGRSNAWRVVRREAAVGLSNGALFAVMVGIAVAVFYGSADIGFVIGAAFLVVLTIAAIAGILIPLGLVRLGADPAVSSGPFVTTVTDVVGFLSFLGIATWWFHLT